MPAWKSLVSLLALAGSAASCAHHGDAEVVPEHEREELLKKWDQEWSFTGIASFAHLKPVKCLIEPTENYDIAVIGAPFDTAVSYRPGARFGPRAIRAASARQMAGTSYNTRAGINPYKSWAKITDCGDIPITPFDNGLAERQMYEAFLELGSRKTVNKAPKGENTIGSGHPKLVTLGGDHSVALPALRALHKIYQKPITVLHFDAHLDTWNPVRYSAYWQSEQTQFNHGSFFHKASREGLICNATSAHAGLRTRLTGVDAGDYTNPGPEQGFIRIHADDIDDLGPMGVVDTIIQRTGLDPEQPVYLSVDIDVLDPSTAPGTGTPEPGGWTTREFIRILRGLEKLNLVGADIVEVSPAYDNKGETTALAAAQVAFEIITSMVKAGVDEDLGGWYGHLMDSAVVGEAEAEAEDKVAKDEL
ncbi:Ureohydrolase [Penicillium cinerascens]|uniref:agmatinase n=1 Tax=Penicillium cinerascens TaxID=70096 RepID=A0A9W9JJ61_9EURO|nr:Ureohydrolase [Penicillium cinerascens]KAJ5195256.1 Ureohydrolase [Penicillium cinerascens]